MAKVKIKCLWGIAARWSGRHRKWRWQRTSCRGIGLWVTYETFLRKTYPKVWVRKPFCKGLTKTLGAVLARFTQ